MNTRKLEVTFDELQADAATWTEFLRKMHSGDQLEIDETVYDYFLEVLPPKYGRFPLADGRTIGCDFGFAEGAEPITAFWRRAGRFYCQRTAAMARG